MDAREDTPAMSIAQRMTYADLMKQPEDNCLHELVRGGDCWNAATEG
jgi:hypothetical protein